MTTPDQLAAARRAKTEVQERYGAAAWFRGVGLAPHGDGLVVRLNVAPDGRDSVQALPKELGGVPIEIVYMEAYSPRARG